MVTQKHSSRLSPPSDPLVLGSSLGRPTNHASRVTLDGNARSSLLRSATTMDAFETHVRTLVGLTSDRQRKAYIHLNPELYADESVRLLCRQAVALLYSNVTYARSVCQVLTVLARVKRTPLTFAYRDHAWGAVYFNGGSDYRKAFTRWKRAIVHFDQIGRSDEAAITRLSALPTLICLDQLDLFDEWVDSARAIFERNGDRLRLARLRSNTAHLHLRRCEWSLAADAYDSAYKELVAAGAGNQDLFVALTNLAVCHTYLGDLPRAANLITKARFLCEDAGLSFGVRSARPSRCLH